MKLNRMLIVAAVLLSVLLAGCAAQTPTATVVGRPGVVRVGVDPSLAPFASLGANNTPVGLDIDLIQAVMAKAGLQYELINAGINIPTLLEQCRLEVAISALPVTKTLQARALLTPPYYTTRNALLVKQGNLVIDGLDRLAGMTVGSELGTPAEAEVAGMAGATSKPYPNISLAIMDLANGQIDAVAADLPHARSVLAVKRNNLKIVGAEFGSVQYGIAVCKGRADLFEQVNSALAAVRADGTLEKLVAKWLPRP